MIYSKKFKDFLFILGEKSVDLFNYFNVEELHGLNKKDALKYKENNKDAYIYGLANYIPKKSGTYKYGDPAFVFINFTRLDGTYKDHIGIMHETIHLSLLLNNWDVDNKEEEIVTNAEIYAGEIIEYIQGPISVSPDGNKKNIKSTTYSGDSAFEQLWQEVNKIMSDVWNSKTFANLVDFERNNNATDTPNYVI